MFTGLIGETGRVACVSGGGTRKELTITAPVTAPLLGKGDSVAIDGVCQTVTAVTAGSFTVDVMEATLAKTTLKYLSAGSIVNLEKALAASDPIGGHLVQGHVSGIASIVSICEKNSNIWLTLDAPAAITKYCIPEGSIAVDGISLTIASISGSEILVNIIPETWKRTALRHRRNKSPVNIETDMIGRYIVAFLEKQLITPGVGSPDARGPGDYAPKGRETAESAINLTFENLRKWGY